MESKGDVFSTQPAPTARFWKSTHGNAVQCNLCPHNCLLKEGGTGLCRVRKVVNGQLVSLVYGRPAAMGVDPIEKKPLFHMLPGAPTFSYATHGCNLRCSFCQNHSLSQVDSSVRAVRFVKPQQIVQAAADDGCKIIAHTYSEPTIYIEYALDIARLAREQGMKNVFVSNGFISPEPLREACQLLDGANIDLKAFQDATYQEHCNGRLEPVLDTIKMLHSEGVLVEVTTLLVPGLNDGPEELSKLAGFLAGVSRSVPWHISRFHPDFKMLDRGPTSLESLQQAYAIGKEAGLQHIYVGNVRGNDSESTFCPSCDSRVIWRAGFSIRDNGLVDGRCPSCNTPIPGIWS